MNKDDKSIAIVGLPDSGKSVLLTVLFQGSNWTIQELNRDTMQFFAEKKAEIKSGHWPAPTPDNCKARELAFRVARRRSDNSIILKSRDYAGEGWINFINKYCEYGDNKEVEECDKEICDFLKGAVAIAICVDLEKLFDGDLDQKWIIQAILNFIENHNLSLPLAIVVTKYDRIEKYLNEKYCIGEHSLPEIADSVAVKSLFSNSISNHVLQKYLKTVSNIVTREFGNYIAKKINPQNVFFIAAVKEDTGNYSYEDEKFAPQREFKSIGIRSLESWIWDEIQNASKREHFMECCKILVPIIAIIAASVVVFVWESALVPVLGILCLVSIIIYKIIKHASADLLKGCGFHLAVVTISAISGGLLAGIFWINPFYLIIIIYALGMIIYGIIKKRIKQKIKNKNIS